MLEYPLALVGLGITPAQSVATFGLLTIIVMGTAWVRRDEACRQSTFAVASGEVIGLAMGLGLHCQYAAAAVGSLDGLRSTFPQTDA